MNPIDDASEPFGAEQSEVAGAQLIDVRRAAAFHAARCMLPTAMWRDPDNVDEWAHTLLPDREVIVYCVHGHEVSRNATMRLRALGLNARFMRGGFDAWQSAGMPLVDK